MKTKKQKTEIPENIPVITPEMMEKTAIETAKRRAGKKGSPMKGVRDIECPSCGGGKIGMYFPKDVLRVMKVSKSDKAILTPLSNRKMVIELLNSTA